jgi:hypothetical protein
MRMVRKKIVEFDESPFFKNKYNRGRRNLPTWYVGGVERGSNRCFIVPVENRNTETMINIISTNVYEEIIIITDEWRAYGSALRNLRGFEHLTINHSLNFVDPDDPLVHTQTIESLWSHAKKGFFRKMV